MIFAVWIDGACGPVNPGGVASYGVIIVELGIPGNITLNGIVGSGELMSNNVGEYSALIAFLEWYANRIESTKERQGIIIYSDSQLVVNQMGGNWRCHPGKLYTQYHHKAKGLILDLGLKNLIQFVWVSRDQNTAADTASRMALTDAGINI